MGVTILAAVAFITLSNQRWAGPSGSPSGAGSGGLSRILFTIGAASAITFVVLAVLALLARRGGTRSSS
jgi:hypothetical protein